MYTLKEIMADAVDRNASDIHLKTGNQVIYRIDGDLVRMDSEFLTEEMVQGLLSEIAGESDVNKFLKVKELDLSYVLEDVARFRVNVCRDDGDTRIVLRLIPLSIKKIEDLGLPVVLKKIARLANGLVLVTGPTGSGKSTSLAAIIDEINSTRPVHIITVEDPLEFVHQDKMAIITQREVGHDTLSFANALRGALRQDPDVILIGEMRDAETVRTALASAETGHLVFSTLHTVDAVETLNRIIDFFEPHQQLQIRKQLASVLRGVMSQRILPLKEGAGRTVAVEVLIGNRTVRDFIEQGKSFKNIVKLIEEGESQYGMQTFDQALFKLFKEGRISETIALHYATSPKDLKLRMDGLGRE
ncbi:MAG TPA: PilT/PilU family type 4a pilus ATPase [Candidatus Hydrogenedentes bacterium]|nr:PilT/PilU family type 4a pilus ATPase [Candidatus Hydrogenedentota bacterium]HPG69952.1 PilT/PilU family type 4a pilus ATPase [Candidatus Hydrogenedentota bacterium]